MLENYIRFFFMKWTVCISFKKKNEITWIFPFNEFNIWNIELMEKTLSFFTIVVYILSHNF